LALKRLLKKAAKRGVNVQVVLSAVSDVGLVKNATEYFYTDMLNSGIKLYEWKQSVLHAKVALIDSDWLSVGSYNLNHLSDFGSIECNLEVIDEAFCTLTNNNLKLLMEKGCESISLEKFKYRSKIFSKIYQATCYGILRLLLGFMFLLQSRNVKKKRYF
jgi:cardiolipin synthase A/B